MRLKLIRHVRAAEEYISSRLIYGSCFMCLDVIDSHVVHSVTLSPRENSFSNASYLNLVQHSIIKV